MRAFLLALLSSPVVAFSVTLNWDALPANSGVVGYDIHYGPVAATPSTHVTVGNVITAVIPATGTNYYTVTGRDGTGKISKSSNQVMWPASTPSPPQVSFSLAWNAVANANSYRVFENNTQIAEITALNYSLAGKAGPKTYTVRSVGVSGQSAPSNSVTLAAPTPTPSPSPSPSPTPSPVPIPAAPVLQLQQT